MASKVGLTFLDESGEKSRVEYTIADVGAGNVAGIIDNAQFSTAGSLAALFASLSLCTPIQSEVTASVVKSPQTSPGSNFAQREIGLMVSYTDNVTGKMFRVTIPGPDWANIGLAGSDQVNPEAAQWTAFKTKFEADVKSPDGNAVTISGGRLVGRNR